MTMANGILVNRLEAATSRLEDMAMALDDPKSPKPVDPAVSAAVQPSAPAQPKIAAPPAPSAAPQIPPQIEDFDALIKNEVQNFVNLGEKIGGLVEEQVRQTDRQTEREPSWESSSDN